jgi:hypothetical protein
VDAIQKLVETDALKRLKGRYFYHLDKKEWDKWAALFVKEAVLLVDSGAPGPDMKTSRYEGIDRMVEHTSSVLTDKVITVHQGHTPLFEFDSDTEARGIWAMFDLIDRFEAGILRGHGHYVETYRKVDGEWKFTSVYLTRLRTATTLV